MPTGLFSYCNRRNKMTWKNMSRGARKRWHRENRCREVQGLAPLPKP